MPHRVTLTLAENKDEMYRSRLDAEFAESFRKM